MDLKITNTSKDRPVFRFGQRFNPEKTVEFKDATPQQYLALRAVRALKVEVVQPVEKTTAPAKAKPAAKKSDAPTAPAIGDAAATGSADAGAQGEPSGKLADMDYKELQELAKAMDLKYVGVSKDDLIAAIEEARRQAALEPK